MLKHDAFFWLTVFLAFFYINNVHAVGNQNIGFPDGVSLDAGGNYQYQFRDRDPRPIYPDVENRLKFQRDFDAYTSKGRIPITVDQKSPVTLNKLGKAVTNLTKRLGPLAYALAARQLVCDLSNICVPPNGTEYQHKQTNDELGYSINPQIQYSAANSPRLNEPMDVWPYFKTSVWGNDTQVQPPTNCAAPQLDQQCTYMRGTGTYTFNFNIHRTCSAGYTYNTTTMKCDAPANYQPNPYRPLVPQDYIDAEPKLNDPRLITPTIDAGEPIEVGAPETQPKSIPLSRTSETTRDGSGTATGTKTTETTLKIDPTPSPTVVKVSETTTITTTNITNNTTNTTTITDEPSAELPPEKEETEIEFDEVPDEPPLTDFTPDVDYSDNSWGGGSCPAAPVMSTSKGTYLYNIQPACDFVSSARPIILLLAGLAALYIISGVKTD